MDLLDIVIVLLVVGGVASGWRRGLSWVGLSFAGLVVGLLIGAAVAAPLARRVGGHNASSEALIGTGIFLACVAIVQGVGTALGYRIRLVALRSRAAVVDSGLGAGLAAVAVLAVAWFLGLNLASTSSRALNSQINRSGILRVLDHLVPRPPAFLNSLGHLLQDPAFVNPFDTLGGTSDLSPLPDVPADLRTPGIDTAVSSTVKVYSQGCGIEAGSGWPLGDDYFATNAHVVAGGQTVQVQLPGRSGRLDATVVLYDPQRDVAVLRAPGAGLRALPVGGDPARGVTGAVVGYPGGGNEQAVPAAVRGVEDAEGRDIYGSSIVVRRIVVLQAHVIPGNSGGPIVDRNGAVVGMVFAASTTDETEGYALAMSTINGDLSAARGLVAAVSTQDCTT